MKRKSTKCPDCGDIVYAEPVDRRSFLRAAGAGAAALAMARVPAWGQDAKPDRSAEEMIKELFGNLSDEQKKQVIHPFDDARRGQIYNRALDVTIGKAFTKPQQDLVQKIVRALASDENGWNQITRGGTWDASKSFDNCGADLFGSSDGKYTFVFSGHHLTLRCDGDSVPGPALGGPLYYGHTPNGYSSNNLFQYQTKSALAVFDGMTEEQRGKAVIVGSPGEGLGSIKFRAAGEARPGIALGEFNKDQLALVEKVMRDLLSPYRKADGDEAMEVVKAKGGLEKLNLAFYKEKDATDPRRMWSFWRIEGAGFVWNFRVLPHVHTFVNISAAV